MPVIKPRYEPGFPFASYNMWRGTNAIVQRALPRLWDFAVVREEPFPAGPVVVAANHFSHIDPVVAAVAAGRPTRFLGVDELFGRSRFFDGLTYFLGVIPMPRGTVPLRSMRTAVDQLASGGGVTLFPEGRRVSEWGESPPKEGAAWLARRMGCPLIPMALWGTGEAMGLEDLKLRRHPIRVAIGKAMDPGEYADRSEMTVAWHQWMTDALARLEAF